MSVDVELVVPVGAGMSTKVMVVPSTVMVSPAAKLAVSESLAAAPDSTVLAVIGTGVAAWLSTAVPVIGGVGERRRRRTDDQRIAG